MTSVSIGKFLISLTGFILGPLNVVIQGM
ncbi:uncharacterized protein ARMOST_21682 [Armillaria ostoyae]|uniref:Uncharacterized protein n=1 Tax=Armillaria ostoyae TaxID=47428 RepID=A0A284SAR0_ARMOS|nr:uncharacterized protein ARMOST_21682 [Armillaria ostoyae]